MSITIKKVSSRKELKEFILFPEMLFKDEPMWVPSLISDEFNTLDKKKNHSFKNADADYFLAYKDGKLVGRVAAIINNNANVCWEHKAVRFGWIDFIDDIEVSKALIDTVKEWGRERGMNEIKGPLGFTDMDKEGLLVDGFDNLSTMVCISNPPYYMEHFEELGLVKDVDWIQYSFYLPKKTPEKLVRFSELIQKRYGLRILQLKDKKRLLEFGQKIFELYNEAYSPLYEFAPLNEEQIKDYVKQYIPMVNPELLCLVVNNNDDLVGFAVTMPSLSEALQKSKGRLFPFGFRHLLKALKKSTVLDLYLVGVQKEYQNKGLTAVIYHYLHQNSRKFGIRKVITNPQLEENYAIQQSFQYYEKVPFQRRRSYIAKL